MRLYNKYCKLNIELDSVGFCADTAKSDCFCMPKGAKKIGNGKDDGIIYCFIKEFKEMVFAVNPYSKNGEYVLPVAESFEDFLRLLISLGSTYPICNANSFSENQINDYINDNEPTGEQRSVLKNIKIALGLSPISDPFSYIKNLQKNFDFSLLRMKKESRLRKLSPASRAAVFFNSDFDSLRDGEKATHISAVNLKFSWEGQHFIIPAVYKYKSGIVIDVCTEIDEEAYLSYKKGMSAPKLTPEDKLILSNKNPFNTAFSAILTLNGSNYNEFSRFTMEIFPGNSTKAGLKIVRNYHLDTTKLYAVYRINFKIPEHDVKNMASLSITLKALPRFIPGSRFETPENSESIKLINPVNNSVHLLKLEKSEHRKADSEFFKVLSEKENILYPCYFNTMNYKIYPDMQDSDFRICDCESGDTPVECGTNKPLPNLKNINSSLLASSHVVMFNSLSGENNGEEKENKLRSVCSSLYFAPQHTTTWRIDFSVIPKPPVTKEIV